MNIYEEYEPHQYQDVSTNNPDLSIDNFTASLVCSCGEPVLIEFIDQTANYCSECGKIYVIEVLIFRSYKKHLELTEK